VEQELAAAEIALPLQGEQVIVLRAGLLVEQSRGSEASRLLEQAVEEHKASVPIRVALAETLSLAFERDQALAVLDRAAADIGPNKAFAFARIGILSRAPDDKSRAALTQLSDEILNSQSPQTPELLEALGRAWAKSGNLERARRVRQALVDVQPDNLVGWLALLEITAESVEVSEYRRIIAQLRRIEGDDGTWWRYAAALSQLGQLHVKGDAKAFSTLNSSINDLQTRRGRDWWGAHVLLGGLAELQSDSEGALKHYLQALENGYSSPQLGRKIVGLFYQRRQFEEVDRVIALLNARGIVEADMSLVTVLNAIRSKDLDRALALTRDSVSPDSSNYRDHMLVGYVLSSAGKLDDAEQSFRKAVALAPEIPECWVSLVRCQIQSGRSAQAQATVAEAAERLTTDHRPLPLALCYELIGDATHAESFVTQALTLTPHDPTTLKLAASFYLRLRKPETAAPLLDRLLDAKANAPEADLAWARKARQTLNFDRSKGVTQLDDLLQVVEGNLRQNPFDFDEQRLRATLLATKASRRKEAIAALEELNRSKLLAPNEEFLLAMLYAANEKWAESESILKSLLSRPKKDPRHLVSLISFLIRQGKADEAESWLAKLKPLQPTPPINLQFEAEILSLRAQRTKIPALLSAHAAAHPADLGYLATLLDRNGFFPEAEAAYKEHAAQTPNDTSRLMPLADLLARLNRTADAFALLLRASENCSEEDLASTALALLEAPGASEAERTRAETWLARACEIAPRRVDLLTKLAIVRIRQGRIAEGETLNRRALAQNPDYLEALNNLAWVLSLHQPARTEEALRLLDHAIAIAGPEPNTLDTRAVVLLRAGRAADALSDLRALKQIARNSPTVTAHLAWALQQVGRIEEARSVWLDAVRLGLVLESLDPLEKAAMRGVQSELEAPKRE
jgi:Flp pilus assembly protein TadD